jgi:TRAP-type C4-dicarboxylate transport system permease small subunit
MKSGQDVIVQPAAFRTFRHAVFESARALDLLSAAAIVGMMALTCADVAMRFFRRPITGTYEMVAFLGALAVSLSIAHTSAEKGHVAVNLIVRLLPRRAQGIIETLIAALSLTLFAMIAWRMALYAQASQRVGEVSLTLQFPLYPIKYGIAFGTGIVCVVCLVDLIEGVLKIFPPLQPGALRPNHAPSANSAPPSDSAPRRDA